MKNGIVMALVATLFSLGTAQADVLKPGPGFDRVGAVSVEPQRMPDNVKTQVAPGEGTTHGAIHSPERKREMARRLVWLMLSAR